MTQGQSIFNNPNACSNNSKTVGTTVGLLVGAAIGAAITHNVKGALLGGVAGGVAGFTVGAVVDNRRCSMYRIAQAHNLEIASAPIMQDQLGSGDTSQQNDKVGTNVVIQDNGQSFQPGTAEMTPNAQSAMGQIAQQYSPQNVASAGNGTASLQEQANIADRTILVISHTNSSDAVDSQSQKQISTDRARSVAQQLAAAGVPSQNLYYQGAANSQPASQSDSPQAEAADSSVQIIDLPNKQALTDFLQNSTPAPATAAIAAANTTSSASLVAPGMVKANNIAIDFGGKPVSQSLQTVDIGPLPEGSALDFISTARAATPVSIKACTLDTPRKVSPVTNLATGETLPVRNYLPGFYGAPWAGGFNGNLVDVLNMLVPKDAGATLPPPKLQIYKNYHNGMQKPTFAHEVPVNVYRGQTATLYRIFDGGPIDCMDIVVSSISARGTGTIYYHNHGSLYVVSGDLALQKN